MFLGESLDLVARSAGLLVSIAAALRLSWRGRTRWEPSEEDIPDMQEKVAVLFTAIAIGVALSRYGDARHSLVLLAIAKMAGIVSFGSLLAYIFLIGIAVHTLPAEASSGKSAKKTRVVGGFVLTAAARQLGCGVSGLLSKFRDANLVWEPWSRAVVRLILVLCYLGLSVGGALSLVAVVSIQDPSSRARILFPPDTALVGEHERISGTLENAPNGTRAWVVVFDRGGDTFCPQKQVDLEEGNRWSAFISIGVGQEQAKKYDLLLVLGDSRVDAEFTAYIDRAVSPIHPGLKQLPSNARILARVTVTKK